MSYDNQMENRSCQTHFLFYEITNVLIKNHVDVIYLHFGKAFRLVPNDILIKKIKLHRINMVHLKWIKSGSCVSNAVANRYVSNEVPQESVLIPQLLTIAWKKTQNHC